MVVDVRNALVDDSAWKGIPVFRDLIRGRGIEPSVMSFAADDDGHCGLVGLLSGSSVEFLEGGLDSR